MNKLNEKIEYTHEEKLMIKQAKYVKNHYSLEITPGMTTNSVKWVSEGNKHYGYGFQPKGKEKIYLVKCPACNRENYAANVQSGICTWCPFDANGDINA